ncbi:MAG: NADH oxidoreductase, partial [Mesorhizobium sp.]
MTLPSQMRGLLLVGDGYTRTPSAAALEAMEPYLKPGSIAVPEPGPTQAMIKVSLASINPSDIAFIKGQYGQPRVKGRPAGFEGVGMVVATGDDPYAKSLAGKRVAFATGVSNWGAWADYAVAEAASCIPLIDTVRDEDGAAMIVNPLTALAMFDIVREEGEKAFVMTAGASQLCKLIIGLAKEAGF